jgi:D-amino-acid oxidase
MKNIWFFGSSYIIPNVDTVVLGGTAQKGDWNTTVSLQDTEKIISNIAEVFPAIRDAPIVSGCSSSSSYIILFFQENAWVGLRPGRTPLRLERDSIPREHNTFARSSGIRGKKSGNIHVIHCYGHGGSGVTLAMGCAQDVAENHVQPLLGLRVTKDQLHSSSTANLRDGNKLSTWFNVRSRL